MAFDPDHGHSHAHGTGIKWLDIIVGVSVVFISVLSLVVSIQHGQTMEKMVDQNEKMVAANTLPLLTVEWSQLDPNGQLRTSLHLKNGGVGPALIDWFEIRYKGRSIGDLHTLLTSCCAEGFRKAGDGGQQVYYSNVSGTILPAREMRELVVVTSKAPKEAHLAINAAREDMSLRACYCSVLDECWLTDFGAGRPKRVKTCAVPKDVNPW